MCSFQNHCSYKTHYPLQRRCRWFVPPRCFPRPVLWCGLYSPDYPICRDRIGVRRASSSSPHWIGGAVPYQWISLRNECLRRWISVFWRLHRAGNWSCSVRSCLRCSDPLSWNDADNLCWHVYDNNKNSICRHFPVNRVCRPCRSCGNSDSGGLCRIV